MIPTLDLHAEPTALGKSLVEACSEYGCFYLENTGLDDTLASKALDVSRQFFALPLEEKLKIDFQKSPHWRGYSGVGEEITAGKRDMREQIDIGQELQSGYAPEQPDYSVIRGPNQWPSEEMKQIITDYQDRMKNISNVLTAALDAALGSNIKESLGDIPYSRMKIVRYPSKAETESTFPNEVFGCGPHKDYMFWGFLLQEPGVCALQCQLNSGDWVDCPPIDGTLVCTLGEMLQVATDGVFKATTHRVQVPSLKSRISLNWFIGPDLDKVTEPVKMDLAPKFSNVKFDGRADHLYAVAGKNYIKGMVRSHPGMVAHFHPELYGKYGIAGEEHLHGIRGGK